MPDTTEPAPTEDSHLSASPSAPKETPPDSPLTEDPPRRRSTDLAEDPAPGGAELVHSKRYRIYQAALGVILLFLVGAGCVVLYQTAKLNRLRSSAENIFYSTKSLELQIARLEETVVQQGGQKVVAELSAKRTKLQELNAQYGVFVNDLGVYNVPEQEQVILRVARIFGECDAAVPREFVAEVQRYIRIWRGSDRLQEALERAKKNGCYDYIPKMLAHYNLPPHFFYLCLQESDFNRRAVGKPTKYGYAKGMWQFIPLTAKAYGLKIGPLHRRPVFDRRDERFNVMKSTVAAMRYIRDLSNTDAQGSGLLVMASYNWGENNVRDIINSMPRNARERNFWRLLAKKNIPRETYDYVFLIFSAAVICEYPDLFGFDLERPPFAGKVPHGAGHKAARSRT